MRRPYEDADEEIKYDIIDGEMFTVLGGKNHAGMKAESTTKCKSAVGDIRLSLAFSQNRTKTFMVPGLFKQSLEEEKMGRRGRSTLQVQDYYYKLQSSTTVCCWHKTKQT